MVFEDEHADPSVETEPTSEAATASGAPRRPEMSNAYVAPQTVLQEVLASVWEGLLDMEKIGIEDDFFELGGDSVLATQIISRLRETFRMDLPLIVLFEASSIKTLGEYMIANESQPGRTEKTAAVLKQIENMTEDEVSRSLLSR
jgi:surfactin family lipopeptide synthetase C